MLKRAKPSPKRLAEIEQKKEETRRLRELEKEIWAERPHKSEISGEWLGNTIKTYFFHHILPKSSCPQLKFNKDNIILLTFEEHQQVENNENKFPEINLRRDKLLLTLLSGAGIITKI